ncbi:zinc finger BED domain-containing protein 4-like [Solenopsis invicta]|uniref:zinc finger BED domain-containing protein 4-like n=1 Tax=Solenopsis invicta TaxID=13686 RepID=UPI00193D9315|nr:zinc finger BED domain-containing protein 4-like [Solenopsis invicta]
MSGESYVTCSKIIPIVNCLIKTLNKFNTEHEISEFLHKNVLRELCRRFQGEDSNVEINPFLAISTLLDPRFKKLHFRNALAVSTAMGKICQLIKEENSSSSQNFDELGGIPVELRQFLNANVVGRTEDPLKVWQKLKDIYPTLYKVAMKYFVIVGTSVPSERLFSAAGDTISAKRSRITGKQASQTIFLGSLPEKYWK